MSCGSIGGGGTITDSVDTVGSDHRHVVVYNETTSLVLSLGQLGHQFTCDLSRGVSGSPNQQPVWDFSNLLVGVLDDDGSLLDILDHGSSENVDLVVLELRFGVVDELLGECREDVRQSLDQGDPETASDLGVPLLEIILDTISNHCPESELTIKKSCSSPAYSTPVGPPPTTIMCINRSISSTDWSLKAAVSIPGGSDAYDSSVHQTYSQEAWSGSYRHPQVP